VVLLGGERRTVGLLAASLIGLAVCGDDGTALEDAAQALDIRHGPVGEVAEGSLPDLAVVAIALAQQDGGGRVPVGDGFDTHGGMWARLPSRYKSKD
jgi:hypothetical protein